MIRIDELRAVPNDLSLLEMSRKQFEVAGAYTPKYSPHIWAVSDDQLLFVCGVYRPALTSIGEFWILLCEAFTQRTVRNVRTAISLIPPLLEHYPLLHARASVDDFPSRRFMEVCGFTQKGVKEGYAWYEVRKCLS